MRWTKIKSSVSTIPAVVVCTIFLGACEPPEPVSAGFPPDVRRLTEDQYRNIIGDVFGKSIVVAGRFDTPVREEGLLALGARDATVTPGGLVQFDEMARSIAAQVMDEPNRHFLVPCDITNQTDYDQICAAEFISKYGRLLFRRPLSKTEHEARLTIVQEATDSLGSFANGLTMGLASMLMSPKFLFITEIVEVNPRDRDAYRLNTYSIASRLSLLLWNTTPDDALLTAAENGELHTDEGLEANVERMIASPRFKTGVEAFFSDMLEFSEFDFLEKDSVIYPAFGVAAVRDAEEQTLRTIVDHVINLEADYRDLFITRKTFINRTLGLVYRVQVEAPRGTWQPYEFAPDDPRVGIQTHVGFLSLNSHPGRSSATLRGSAIREMLLCQKVPDPPPDVDFSGFNDPDSPAKTARERLDAHSTNAACAGCHRITDPIGLALENFDGAGKFRLEENGFPIDTSGDLDGIAFEDSAGLGSALRNNHATTACLVNRLYAYASGTTFSSRDPWMAYLEENFAKDGYSVKSLLKRIATSKSFYAVSPFYTSEETIKTAANTAVSN